MNTMAIAYSYMRFSSAAQKGNTSIIRQTALRDEFVKEHGLTLDTKLKMTDEGVSAREGKHRDAKNCLGNFVSLVQSGEIPAGSYLIVESLDRLSREQVDIALQFLLSLTNAGIKVVQLEPMLVIYQKPVDQLKLIMGIMEMTRAWSESEMKSNRVAKAWNDKHKRARENKTAQTAQCPRWLRRNKDVYEIIPERGQAVKLIFKLCADGVGINQIIRQLIENKLPPFEPQGSRLKNKVYKWSPSTIAKTLHNRACIGEYQPFKNHKAHGQPIKSYYPSVIDEDTFLLAQHGLLQRCRIENRKRKPKGGRYSNEVNLFSGLMFNAIDGDKIEYRYFQAVRKRKGSKPISKYVNSLALVAQAKLAAFPVQMLERAVLSCLAELKPSDIMPSGENHIEDNFKILVARKTEVDTRLNEILNQLITGKGSVSILSDAAENLTAQQKELAAQIADINEKKNNPVENIWSNSKSLISMLSSSKDVYATRLRLRSAIKDLIERMDCVFVREGRRQIAVVQIHFHDTTKVRTIWIRHRCELTSVKEKTPEYNSWETLVVKQGYPDGAMLRDKEWSQFVLEMMRDLCDEKTWQARFEPKRLTSAEKTKAAKKIYMKQWKRKNKRHKKT